jgi:hypothetical protein
MKQRKGEHDHTLKERALKLFLLGCRTRDIAQELDVPEPTVSQWRAKFKKGVPLIAERPITELMLTTASIKDHEEFKKIVLASPSVSMLQLSKNYGWNYNAAKKLVKKYQLR